LLSFDVDEWISILKLSTMWDFRAIKEKAIDQVFHQITLDPLTKLLLAKDYELVNELLSSLNHFTQQRLVTVEDANVLGLDYFLKILEVQECIDPASKRIKCSQCHNIQNDYYVQFPVDRTFRRNYDFTTLLQLVFQDEMGPLDSNLEGGCNEASEPGGTTHLKGPEKADIFFQVDVFFLVSSLIFVYRRLTVFFRLKIASSKVFANPSKNHLFFGLCLTFPPPTT
jgi:hypothetical protein